MQLSSLLMRDMHCDINSNLQSENVPYCLYTEHSSTHLQCYNTYRICTLVINIKSIVILANVRLTPTHLNYLFIYCGIITYMNPNVI